MDGEVVVIVGEFINYSSEHYRQFGLRRRERGFIGIVEVGTHHVLIGNEEIPVLFVPEDRPKDYLPVIHGG